MKNFSYQGKGLSTDLPKNKFAELKALIESRIKLAVKECYGCFVTPMLPIISQANLNSFMKKFVELMP
jgi:hypothetical protein